MLANIPTLKFIYGLMIDEMVPEFVPPYQPRYKLLAQKGI
jgi:hypothetical protein